MEAHASSSGHRIPDGGLWWMAISLLVAGSLAALISLVLAFGAGAILTYDLDGAVSTSPDTGFSAFGFWFGIGTQFAGTFAFAVVGLASWIGGRSTGRPSNEDDLSSSGHLNEVGGRDDPLDPVV
jgi:hypothetical protein